MKPHTVSGRLEGRFETILGSSSRERKRLIARLVIEGDNTWHMEFIVRHGASERMAGALSTAIRWYDAIAAPATEAACAVEEAKGKGGETASTSLEAKPRACNNMLCHLIGKHTAECDSEAKPDES